MSHTHTQEVGSLLYIVSLKGNGGGGGGLKLVSHFWVQASELIIHSCDVNQTIHALKTKAVAMFSFDSSRLFFWLVKPEQLCCHSSYILTW